MVRAALLGPSWRNEVQRGEGSQHRAHGKSGKTETMSSAGAQSIGTGCDFLHETAIFLLIASRQK